jgi:hypothetical protein
VPPSSSEEAAADQGAELLAYLSAQLALVEAASIALQKFEEQPEIGSICVLLEHAVQMLAGAHERVEHYLRETGS